MEDESVPQLQAGPILVVAADGSGTHRRLAAAVADAAAGATIYLRGGQHVLDDGLVLTKSLTLVGDGIESTEIVAGCGPFVLQYEGDGPFALLDLAVRWAGPRDRLVDVVRLLRGSILVSRCHFSGSSVGDGTSGCGLELDGPVRGTVSHCIVEGNAHGIVVAATAEPLVQHSICHDNENSGIFYCGSAAGVAAGNRCHGNGTHGIHLSQEAHPRLLENVCADNGMVGIAYLGSAGGSADGNICTGNRYHGIGVTVASEPLLERNLCQGNAGSGIYYNERAAGAARQNDCRDNGEHGIAVEEEAHPWLVENTCAGNARLPIAVSEHADPTLWNNRTSPRASDNSALP